MDWVSVQSFTLISEICFLSVVAPCCQLKHTIKSKTPSTKHQFLRGIITRTVFHNLYYYKKKVKYCIYSSTNANFKFALLIYFFSLFQVRIDDPVQCGMEFQI